MTDTVDGAMKGGLGGAPAQDRARAEQRPQKLAHFAAVEPFDPDEVEAMSAQQERYYMASQWRMMWWKLKRHRLAVASGFILLVMYLSILISEFLAPYGHAFASRRFYLRAAATGSSIP